MSGNRYAYRFTRPDGSPVRHGETAERRTPASVISPSGLRDAKHMRPRLEVEQDCKLSIERWSIDSASGEWTQVA